jgi:hypothetical protein
MYMGKGVESIMLVESRRLGGQLSTGPNGVFDQSTDRINSPISPPPCKKLYV